MRSIAAVRAGTTSSWRHARAAPWGTGWAAVACSVRVASDAAESLRGEAGSCRDEPSDTDAVTMLNFRGKLRNCCPPLGVLRGADSARLVVNSGDVERVGESPAGAVRLAVAVGLGGEPPFGGEDDVETCSRVLGRVAEPFEE